MEDLETPRHHNDTTVPSVAAFMTATERRSHGGDGSQPERGGGHPGVGRAGTQPARPGVRGAADRGNRLRESSGVSERADGEGAEDHHQLLHRQPGGGRSDARRARPAALRLLRGEDIKTPSVVMEQVRGPSPGLSGLCTGCLFFQTCFHFFFPSVGLWKISP